MVIEEAEMLKAAAMAVLNSAAWTVPNVDVEYPPIVTVLDM